MNTDEVRSTAVWRNDVGIITCPEGQCPLECGFSCPVYCRAVALQNLKNKDVDQSIYMLKMAVGIAPDYYDAWMDMATIYYRAQNDYVKASTAYRCAYIQRNDSPKALSGLVNSYIMLGRYDDAIEFWNKYKLLVDDSEATALHKAIMDAKESKSIKSSGSYFEQAIRIIEKARAEGILEPNDHVPHIPELVVEGESVCRKIHKALISTDYKFDDRRCEYRTWLAWCTYAGIGAVHFWNEDWNKLKSKGIAETLLEPRGAFAMDEFITEAIGIPFASEQGEKLANALMYLSQWALTNIIDISRDNIPLQELMETMQAMYFFGMVLEMELLGMK